MLNVNEWGLGDLSRERKGLGWTPFWIQSHCASVSKRLWLWDNHPNSLSNPSCLHWQTLDGACIQSVSLLFDEDPRSQITLSHLGEVFRAGQYRVSLPYSDGKAGLRHHDPGHCSAASFRAPRGPHGDGIEWQLCHWGDFLLSTMRTAFYSHLWVLLLHCAALNEIPLSMASFGQLHVFIASMFSMSCKQPFIEICQIDWISDNSRVLNPFETKQFNNALFPILKNALFNVHCIFECFFSIHKS